MSERGVHGHWLLIYPIPVPSSRAPINNQGLGAREGDRGQVISSEVEGEKMQGQSWVWRFIYLPVGLWLQRGRQMLIGSFRILSYVIMEHVNWFCNDFYLCAILTSCILVRNNLNLWWHLQLIEIGKQSNERLAVIGKLYFLFCFQTLFSVTCPATGGSCKAYLFVCWLSLHSLKGNIDHHLLSCTMEPGEKLEVTLVKISMNLAAG